ncbi:hypothetical protein TNCV_70711 [Trichonephila clavipes]|nr:hypothetical protein TNCV_70711 [Trichonephila clavipes]
MGQFISIEAQIPQESLVDKGYPSGQGIGSRLACHEFKSSTTEDPPCGRMVHVQSVEISNEGIIRMEWSSCSPERNTVEHVWDIQERRVPSRLTLQQLLRTRKGPSGRMGQNTSASH